MAIDNTENARRFSRLQEETQVPQYLVGLGIVDGDRLNELWLKALSL